MCRVTGRSRKSSSAEAVPLFDSGSTPQPTSEYSSPTSIVAFSAVDGWSRDVMLEIADDVRRRYAG
jgi:hypothetical protein